MEHLPPALAGLAQYPQFILCRIAEKDGKQIKLPLDPLTLQAGSPMDPAIRLPFEEANRIVQQHGEPYRLGFVFTEQDPFFFYDIDHCLAGEKLNDIATWSLQAFHGAAVEWSQSGTGLHIFGTGHCPDHRNKPPASLGLPFKIELYTKDRFVMLTGDGATGDSSFDCTAALKVLVEHYFDRSLSGPSEYDEDWNDFPHPDWDGPEDDNLLLKKALNAKDSANVAFGNSASFKDLFEANEAVLSACYPDDGGRPWDCSQADAALALRLAYWTGNHHERIQRLMERSALVRDKWTDREGYYLPRTIQGATAKCNTFYNVNYKNPSQTSAPAQSSQPAQPNPQHPAPDLANLTTGSAFMSVEEQIQYFRGCHYVINKKMIFTPIHGLLDKDQFNDTYGGKLFCLDMSNQKTTKLAAEAFLRSQAYAFSKVTDICFQPKELPGAILTREGNNYINTYAPVPVPRVKGDATPFLDLISRLVPDVNDQKILLSYLAGIVQYPGQKFQYCVVLQGTEGNGKSTIGRIVEEAVGTKFCERPNAGDLAKNGIKFNGYMHGKLVLILEEFRGDHRAGGVMDTMKTLITNPRIPYEFKGKDQFTDYNVANWILFCNRKDDIPITADSRRYAILYTAQQSREDMLRCGLTQQYWASFFEWYESGGAAICTDWLHTYEIPYETNPAVLSVAPQTSSTEEAIVTTRTDVEQEIITAIDEDAVGFRGGWISFHMASDLLERKRVHSTYNNTAAVLHKLGYHQHPGLPAGKTSKRIVGEGDRRVRLYVPHGHLSENLQSSSAITHAYETAQGYLVNPSEAFSDGTSNAG